MPIIDCELAGTKYKLNYSKISTKKGIEYHGSLYVKEPLEFVYIIFNDGKTSPMFTPLETEPYRVSAILDAIAKDEEEKSDVGFKK